MRIPKILPWFAKKNGISEELAVKLWRRATSEIESLLGEAASSEFNKRSVERFIDLLEAEATALPAGLVPAPKLSWVWRHQNRMTLLSFVAAENACQAWQSAWQNMIKSQRVA